MGGRYELPMNIHTADKSLAAMLTICILLVWIKSVGSAQPPRIYIKSISQNALEISCYADAKTEEQRKFYRIQNNNLNSMFSVVRNFTDCIVSTQLSVQAVQCDCQISDRVVCNVSDKHNEGDQWKCATFKHMSPDFSNNAMVHVYGMSTNPPEFAATIGRTTYLMKEQYSITTDSPLNTSVEVTQTSESHTQTNASIETASSSVLNDSSSKHADSVDDDSLESTSPSFTNDSFYQRFIIIVGASFVVVVFIGAWIVIYFYRKYHHRSDDFESYIQPIGDTVNTAQNTNVIRTEAAAEDRQSTVEIYESIPLILVSPIADCFPLPSNVHNLDTFIMSGRESSIESVHHYESVPSSPNSDGPASTSAGDVSDQHPTTQVLYESLLRRSAREKTQRNTI